MEEVVSLLQIHKQAQTGEFDCAIVDAVPTGETMAPAHHARKFSVVVSADLRGWKDTTLKLAGQPAVQPHGPW
jgi:anion-transporting  ArsA/GET3 family ATPase